MRYGCSTTWHAPQTLLGGNGHLGNDCAGCCVPLMRRGSDVSLRRCCCTQHPPLGPRTPSVCVCLLHGGCCRVEQAAGARPSDAARTEIDTCVQAHTPCALFSQARDAEGERLDAYGYWYTRWLYLLAECLSNGNMYCAV